MSRRELHLMLAVCALALLWPLAHSLVGLGTGFMYLAPALVLLLPLLAGRYVGEERLLRIVRRLPCPRRRVPLAFKPVPSRTLAGRPRGAALLAFSLAVRPPPRAVLATR